MTETTRTKTPLTKTPLTKTPLTLEEALAIHSAAHPESGRVDITDALTAAQEARLMALLTARATDPDWPQKAGAGLAVMEDPRGRLALLLFCGGGLILHRLRLLAWNDTQAILEGQGDPVHRLRLSRAMRLLKRVLMIGCLRRGEVG